MMSSCIDIGESCTTVDRTVAIDDHQAARILDIHGQPQIEQCAAVCAQVLTSDGSLSPDVGVFGPISSAVEGCEVGSNGHVLELVCHLRGICFL